MTTLRAALSRWLLRPFALFLAHLGLRPNHVTLLGLLLHGAVAYLLAQGLLVGGGVLFLLASALDAVDGEMARATGRTTRFGAFLDSTADRFEEGLVFLGLLLLALAREDAGMAVLSFLAFFASFSVSYTRARGEGLGLKGDGGLAPRTVRVLLLGVGIVGGQPTPALALVAILAGLTTLQRIWRVWREAGDT